MIHIFNIVTQGITWIGTNLEGCFALSILGLILSIPQGLMEMPQRMNIYFRK